MLTVLVDYSKTCVLPLENATEISSLSLYTLLCLNYKISSGGDCNTCRYGLLQKLVILVFPFLDRLFLTFISFIYSSPQCSVLLVVFT